MQLLVLPVRIVSGGSKRNAPQPELYRAVCPPTHGVPPQRAALKVAKVSQVVYFTGATVVHHDTHERAKTPPSAGQ